MHSIASERTIINKTVLLLRNCLILINLCVRELALKVYGEGRLSRGELEQRTRSKSPGPYITWATLSCEYIMIIG